MTLRADVAERFRSLPIIAQATIDWLVKKNAVPVTALHWPTVLRRADVLFRADRRFDFVDEVHEAGELLPSLVIEDGGDLWAWSPRRQRLARWLGRNSVLGDPLGPRFDPDGALLVHRDPLSWLRAGREGVVIVDAHRAAIHLQSCGPFLAEDIEHARELRRLLSLPGPDIRVPSACVEAA